MKRLQLLIVFVTAFTVNSDAQYSDKFWCFGDSAGIDFSNLTIPISIITSLDTRGTCASISDSSNNLLFYSNTRAAMAGLTGLVWNRNNQVMQNGDSIYGRGWYYEHTIVPNPLGDNTFYLFTGGVTSYCGFYYSVIDLNLNSGLGAVTQKNVELLGQNFCSIDGLSAIKHANGRDWWVMFKSYADTNNLFYFYLISPSGIQLDHTQNIGENLKEGFYRLKPSKDGSKVAVCTVDGYIAIFNFDRCNGYFTNDLFIEPNLIGSLAPWYWDCELSSNKEFLYVSSLYTNSDSNSYVFQYNLMDTNPSLTRDTIFSIPQPVAGGLLKLGPDNRMYWSCAYETPGTFPYPYPDSVRNVWNGNLSYISYPDSLGTSCDFHPFSFYLGGKRTYYGLPNNPNYELGPIVNSACDTVTSITPISSKQKPELKIFYHSSWQIAFVNASGLSGKNLQLLVLDLSGKMVYNEISEARNGFFTKDLSMNGLASGMYLITLITEKEKLTSKLVIE